MFGLKLGIENIPQFSGGGKPPLYPHLLFYSKKRIGSTGVKEISGTDASLTGASSIYLDGTNSNYMLIPDLFPSSEYGNEMGDFTFCLNVSEFEYTGGTSTAYHFGKYLATGNNRCFALSSRTTSTLYFQSSPNGESTAALLTQVLIYTGDFSEIYQILIRYVNSTNTLTACINGTSTDYELPYKIYNGDADWGVNSASGDVPERGSTEVKSIYVWDVALSDEEIAMINGLSFPATDDMVLGLPISEGEGLINYDISGNGNHSTIYGTDTTTVWKKDITPTSVKEILVYNAPITDAEDLATIMKYLGIGG